MLYDLKNFVLGMNEAESANKRIAKNTLLLYCRMFVTLLIGLYTSREILNNLGVSDYGLYNIVGGVVSMMGFIIASLTGATSRFLTVAIGKGDPDEQRQVFGSLYSLHIILAFIILFIGETVGLWFINTQLNIPYGREYAAFWVYQCTLFSALLSILTIPYNSVLIAFEKMSVFTYFSIIETILKLIIVICLSYINTDKLITYAVLFLLVTIISRGQFIYYVTHKFRNTLSKPIINKRIIKNVSSFSTWTLFSHLSIMGATQGINILLNIFFGTIVNAARAIAVQVQNMIMQFCYNFQMALNPQLTKSYAQGNVEKMHNLLEISSKLSFYLLLLLICPIIIETETILKLWLGEIPDHTIWFVRLILCQSLIYAVSNPLQISIQATGNIKKYQLTEGIILIMVLPISYIGVKFFHTPPEFAFGTYLVVELIAQAIRTAITLPRIHMAFKSYAMKILYPICKVALLGPIVPLIISFYMPDNIYSSLLICLISVISIATIAYCCGCSKQEKNAIKNIIQKYLA